MPTHSNDSLPDSPSSDSPAPDGSAPEGWTREEYAIHARRDELPLFGRAVAGTRDDTGWLTSLSGSIAATAKGAADPTVSKAAEAITRRPRRRA